MRLSILILTHNRPKLFKRCLESVLSQITEDVEVIVNNDSCDIEEISHPQVTYHYINPPSLCSIYSFLLSNARGDYIYYLEDDDYLKDDFLSIDLNADLIAGNYFPTYSPPNIIDIMSVYTEKLLSPKEFLNNLNIEHLQLSQHIFNRAVVTDFNFQMDNNIHNDVRLVIHASGNAKSIRTTNKIFYYQTIDGGDNISFPESKHSVNTTQSLNFLKDYGL
jgi:glycosyltransferase involved in cell wall biosynthesis